MLKHDLQDDGILILAPQGPLEARDFQELARVVDPWIETHGTLKGVLVDAPDFPGWRDFAALLSHLRFVRNHHEQVRRVAAVSDSRILEVLPALAKHFVAAKVEHFAAARREAALAWLRARD